MRKSIYEMQLHEIWIGQDDMVIIRVPGGWIYDIIGKVVFVPFSSEFAPKKKRKIPTREEREAMLKD